MELEKDLMGVVIEIITAKTNYRKKGKFVYHYDHHRFRVSESRKNHA